ncbi:MAG: hypothetical protein ACYC96_04480 [Fimbriimonadaceae bacterium]
MAKKIFALVLTACVLGVVIGGCGSKTDDTSGTASTTGTGTASTTGTTTGK